MSNQQPAWLKRTRPCPFFSQGRCLFADSCNFLHDVKVKNALSQPLPSISPTKQPYCPPKPIVNPPSVVINSASPCLVDSTNPESLSSPAQDSSRYLGLLSVLSDVIGPPSNPPNTGGTAGAALTNSICHSPGLLSEPNSVVSSLNQTGAVTHTGTADSYSGCSELSPVIHADPEANLTGSFGCQTESYFSEGSDVAEFLAVSDDVGSTHGVASSYFMEDTAIYAARSKDGNHEETSEHGEEDFTMVASNRQSTLSSFTGASLLASPRDFSTSDLGGDSATDLLSPVQLSARLRPFPIPPLGSRTQWEDSIDSGCADGDNRAGPRPFPRSPPRYFRSPVTFISHSRHASHSLPVRKDSGVSYDIDVVCTSSRDPIAAIKEVESDGCSEGDSEDSEDLACAILDAYGKSPSEEPEGHKARESLRVHLTVETEVKGGEGDVLSEVPATTWPHSLEHLHPTGECEVESCNQLSFLSDDNLSFQTALSAQPSYEELSDTSKVSPVKQDSLLSLSSGCSTRNTSVLSRYNDANQPSGHSIIASDVYESSFVATCLPNQCDNTPEKALEDAWFPEKAVVDLNATIASSHTDELRNIAPDKVVAAPGHISGVFCSNRQSLVWSATVDISRSLSLVRENLAGASSRANNIQESAPQSSAVDTSPNRPVAQNVLGCTTHDEGGRCGDFPASIIVRRGNSSDVCLGGHFRESESVKNFHRPSSVQDVLGNRDATQKTSDGAIGSMEPSSGALHFDRPVQESGTFTEEPHRLALVKILEHVPSGAYSEAISYDAKRVAPGSDQSVDILSQRLSFPLPPPFLQAGFVGDSILGSGDSSVLPKGTAADVSEGMLEACTKPQVEEMQRVCSGSDLTEKMRLNDLPPFGSGADFTLRRTRAASDLTVKGKTSPENAHEGTPCSFQSSSPPVKQPDQPGPVQPPDDQPPNSGATDNGPEFSHNVSPVSNALKEQLSPRAHLQSKDLTFQREFSPEHSDSCTDSLRSEIVLRPLLTGRKSLLRSSLAEFVPKVSLDTLKEVFPARPSMRLQTRETGSTMVPLGFRRHKPQPVPLTQPSRTVPLQLHTVLPVSQLREILRIRTDVAQENLPRECSSATFVSFGTPSPPPEQSMSAPPTGGLRQLRLSSIINKRTSIVSNSPSIASSILSHHLFNPSTPQSPGVSSTTSFSHNPLLSPSCKQIPEQMHHTPQRSRSNSPILQAIDDTYFAQLSSSTCYDSRTTSAPIQQSKSWRLSHYRAGSRSYTPVDNTRRLSRRTSTLSFSYAVDEEQETDEDGLAVSQPVQPNHVDDWTRPTPVLTPSVHAIATPKPTLLFAIASDDVDQVRQVLESGEAGPNDSVGPQSALAFTLTNDKLAHRPEIVKALLAYGANPSALRNPNLNPAPRIHGANEPIAPPPETTLEGMDPATRYFIARADATHTRQTSQLIYRSFFRPLTRVRYDVIGQDWALEQLFRVLSMHSQKLSVAPIVVFLCGPSGHGKSLLARKFGFLLDVPTHTVNMTTLRSAHDIWQSYSMSPYEEPSSCTLAEFLVENEGKRCVVVLDEIEKVEDQKALWSLLMPWELGRCSLEAGKRHIDARNVIWLATSNVGHELVFEYHGKRAEPHSRMSREDYLDLTALLRPCVSYCLGASLMSRVTTVLPFVPFTLDEKKAIAAEAVHAFAGEASKMSPQEMELLVVKALNSYHPSEGARSLHRAISNILMDAQLSPSTRHLTV